MFLLTPSALLKTVRDLNNVCYFIFSSFPLLAWNIHLQTLSSCLQIPIVYKWRSFSKRHNTQSNVKPLYFRVTIVLKCPHSTSASNICTKKNVIFMSSASIEPTNVSVCQSILVNHDYSTISNKIVRKTNSGIILLNIKFICHVVFIKIHTLKSYGK